MKSKIRKVLFIINKYSGAVYRQQLEGKIVDLCRSVEVECTLEYTQGPGHATELAKHGVQSAFDLIVAVGGDGTVNEVAQGLVHSAGLMGIIPTGSGNGLARHLGIPTNISKATQALFNSRVIKMDTFTVNDKLSVNVSGIGFDGHIANAFGKNGKRGFAGYSKLTLEEYMQFEVFESVVKTAEREVQTNKTFIIAIANSSQYGNNMRIAPQASICDQKLHVYILEKVPPYRLDFIYAFFNGHIDHSHYCKTLKSGSLEIQLTREIEYHVDGEPCGSEKKISVHLQPASLHMLTPSSAERKI